MQKIAEERGGKCLSTEYLDSKKKLEWQCYVGHTWFARPGNVKYRKSWCAECEGLKLLTIEEMQKIAEARGGICLSKKYLNKETNLEWECAEGHTWFARPGSVKNGGHWCLVCSGFEKLTIEEMHQIAKSRRGKCLSKEYVSSPNKLEWECSEGHRWFATAGSIKSAESWCSKCSGNKPLTIGEMQEIAEARGGNCLSKEYVTSPKKLGWECSEGHRWFATAGSIKNSESWCPKCFSFYSEELCRTTFEQLFDEKFIKCKPSWLINSLGKRLELDGYCEYHSIAFEYNGEQHYHLSFYSQKKEDLEKMTSNDAVKVKLCREKGVNLFVITYQDNLIELAGLIKDKSHVMGLDVSEIDFEKKIDFNKVYQHRSYLKEVNKIAEERYGKCLSTKYVNSHTKMEWKCSEGHTWFSTPSHIRNSGSWCPECAGCKRLTIQDMQKIAEARGGKCVSTEYVDNKTKLEWECSEGHSWCAKPGDVKNSGDWCPECAGNKRLTIYEMQKIAEARGGKCVSTEYINSKTKLEWICSAGHKWFARPDTVKNRYSWCPHCYKESKTL